MTVDLSPRHFQLCSLSVSRSSNCISTISRFVSTYTSVQFILDLLSKLSNARRSRGVIILIDDFEVVILLDCERECVQSWRLTCISAIAAAAASSGIVFRI